MFMVVCLSGEVGKEKIEEMILSKLFKEGSLYVTSDTDWDDIRDWTGFLKLLGKEPTLFDPLDLGDVITDVLERGCKRVSMIYTDYPTLPKEFSLMKLYYCTKPSKFFVVLEAYEDEDFAGIKFTVHKDVRSAVRDYNSTIDAWADTLDDHIVLEVPEAEESVRKAREIRKKKLKVKDVLERIRGLEV